MAGVVSGHCALSALNLSLGKDLHNPSTPASLRRMPNTPEAQGEAIAQSLAAKQGEAAVSLVNTRIVCGEIWDSKAISESTTSDSHPVIASNAQQSIKRDSEKIDCHAGLTPARNDSKTESYPLQNLESKTDSEISSGGVYLHRDKNKIAHSRNLKGVAPLKRKSYERIARGEGASLLAVAQPQTHTCTFKPLPP